MNGAESLVRTLVASGVEVCFANPGTSEMHFVAALDTVAGMRAVLCLFEGVATGAADGWARMAGKPAATLLHLGPGFANGIANLHNARKARVPIVNVIGDHATTHLRFDAPLTSDVAGLARPVSHWIESCRDARTVAAAAARAVQAAAAAPGQIASLILPADTAWSPAEGAAPRLPAHGPAPVSADAVGRAVKALRAGKTALLLRGDVLRGAGLAAAGRIAAATGARLVCDTFAPRIERGAGRVVVERLTYRPGPAVEMLSGTATLILVGAQTPIAFFGYPDQPSELVPEGCTPLVLAHPHEDGVAALEAVADALGATTPPAPAPRRTPERPPAGALDPGSLMRIVGRHLPDHGIVSDESITGGFLHYTVLDTAAPHDYLNLAGGAIGDGLPVATGAALACPDRKTVVLQADGSAMYTLQALWTQAREKLDVVTIIYANRAYKVLMDELHLVGAVERGQARALFDLGDPTLDWVRLAEGMGVEAVRVDDTRGFEDAFAAAVAARGPRLIEAVL
ncbi:MAG: acetolactate synthase large subunit [Rhodoplanes sp.]|uniref:acetolactate synthase large subunit n=1 Tax=Rhodoplanes sp. TaxID=1968906 RepID=UPI0017C6E137|nr:acetolactate synthase large subunit [Rhodoplanes sp.]NVO15100.1 acetolactate synthase large subunit [Rhodoplanes sp.]